MRIDPVFVEGCVGNKDLDRIVFIRDLYSKNRQGNTIPAALTNRKPDIVIVMNPIYIEEIKQMLSRKGLAPEMITI